MISGDNHSINNILERKTPLYLDNTIVLFSQNYLLSQQHPRNVRTLVYEPICGAVHYKFYILEICYMDRQAICAFQ